MTRLEELCGEFDGKIAPVMGDMTAMRVAFRAFATKLREEGITPARELPAIVKQILAEAESKS